MYIKRTVLFKKLNNFYFIHAHGVVWFKWINKINTAKDHTNVNDGSNNYYVIIYIIKIMIHYYEYNVNDKIKNIKRTIFKSKSTELQT